MPIVSDSAGRLVLLSALPSAESESEDIAALLGTKALVRRDASEARFYELMTSAPILHLASHALARSGAEHSRDSFVALTPGDGHDGVLTVGELMDHPGRLVADLVVLGACETGVGHLTRAEGTLSLERAFLSKGARNLVVSLWKVDSKATRRFMESFYRHWLEADGGSLPLAQALRLAQEDLRNSSDYYSPGYWAAFKLVGTGRT